MCLTIHKISHWFLSINQPSTIQIIELFDI